MNDQPETKSVTGETRGRESACIRVLIVDDLARVRRGLRTILQLADGLEVVGEAANGREAVQMAEQLNPDVVVMDLEMPELDGFEATRQINHPRSRRCSGKGCPGRRRRFCGEGDGRRVAHRNDPAGRQPRSPDVK